LSKLKINTATLDAAYSNLANAEELMNKWMHDFDPDKAGNTEEQKVNYFKEEQKKIDTINIRINSSIAEAKKITTTTP
jgi:hypothetical protein